jgi:hypothetical protein
VCFRQRGQNFDSSMRSGSFFRFFVVAYVRDRQVEHASVRMGRLSFAISYLLQDLRHHAGAHGLAAFADGEAQTLFESDRG